MGTTYTDENGLYYFIDIESGDYEVHLVQNEQIYVQPVVVDKKELAKVDFTIKE